MWIPSSDASFLSANMWRMLPARYRFCGARMANSNPSPSTRFGPGNPSRGRQRAARDKISTAFLEALNEAFYEPNDSGGCKGLDAIKKVRDEDPATFARIYATLLPKQLEIEELPQRRPMRDRMNMTTTTRPTR
jgi:hypothetical protein